MKVHEKSELERENGKMEERETMATFVRGLLDTMPLSSLTQRKVREKYREKFNKTTLNTEQEKRFNILNQRSSVYYK